ncbi:MAG: hypothetical protein FWG57_04910 [Endomicrobia bacterium]|nr:hypothetical protein [Endomicrobiia bacterium]
MKRQFLSLFAVSAFILPFFACSPAKIDEQQARRMLENAIFSPEQAFDKYKSFYMKTERTVDESSEVRNFINALNEMSYRINALFVNKVIQELYVQDDKLRLSSYVESLTSPMELHLIYDGEIMWSVSNFAAKDSQKMTFAQAKDFIGFPGSDLLRRIRGEYEQSGKEIWYRHAGTQKFAGYYCNVIEMGLKDDSGEKSVFFIDKKTNIVIKIVWPGVFHNIYTVKKIGKVEGEKIPVLAEILYGDYFSALLKYFVKTDTYIHPDVFNESHILLPLRSMFREGRFQNESLAERRKRTRAFLDSVKSFEFVLRNMHLTNFAGWKNIEEIVLPVLEKRLIPDNPAAYRIPIAAEEAKKEKEAAEAKKKQQSSAPKKAPPAPPAKKNEALEKKEPVKIENDETDSLEYSPKDVYKSIEAELEEMKESDPEGYEKMKKIVEEMKAQDANIKNLGIEEEQNLNY